MLQPAGAGAAGACAGACAWWWWRVLSPAPHACQVNTHSRPHTTAHNHTTHDPCHAPACAHAPRCSNTQRRAADHVACCSLVATANTPPKLQPTRVRSRINLGAARVFFQSSSYHACMFLLFARDPRVEPPNNNTHDACTRDPRAQYEATGGAHTTTRKKRRPYACARRIRTCMHTRPNPARMHALTVPCACCACTVRCHPTGTAPQHHRSATRRTATGTGTLATPN